MNGAVAGIRLRHHMQESWAQLLSDKHHMQDSISHVMLISKDLCPVMLVSKEYGTKCWRDFNLAACAVTQ